jgi:chromate transporter
MRTKPGLLFLFKSFLIVGATSFGGYAALVAVVQRILVERKKVIEDEVIVKGFSIASLLPGPVAVNTVTYIGFSLAGWSGALISMIAVILPSMILMIVFAILYETYSALPAISNFLTGVIPVVAALILSAAYNIGKKSFISFTHYIIIALVLLIQFFFSGYWTFFLSFLVGGGLGYLFFKDSSATVTGSSQIKFKKWHFLVLLVLALTVLLNFIELPWQGININLATVFSGISLSLFGGGYVMIPMLSDILVLQKGWLTAIEFTDAIALGQVTPGPILISTTFIGYKLSGIWGAIIATVGIFLPSGLLMILVSDTISKVDRNPGWQAVFAGLKPVIVALMLASIVVLGKSIENWWFSSIIAIISAFLIIRYQVNFLWLIAVAGILGIFLIQ